MRARDLGISIGLLSPGPLNAITDVSGVRVGHTTLISGDAGPLVVGQGPVRTGVTVVVPHDGDPFAEAVYAGAHRLNGNGEMTGLEWIREAGLLSGPIGITNTHSVGIVRDAIVAAATRSSAASESAWSLPVVGETWDGWLSDVDGQHVRASHLDAALDSAVGGAVGEGNVGGGTGMICHHFKGGIGTASRKLPAEEGGFTVGALVQANYGRRERLAIDGVPVGREIGLDEVPSDRDDQAATPSAADTGSIIVVLATDAPLLPHQCERLAQRAGLGVARTGGAGEHSSGDLFIAFATGNRGLSVEDRTAGRAFTREVRALDDAWISSLFWAAIESTEEAIVNSLVAAETMSGANGHIAHRLPHDRLVEVWQRYRG
ncbi:MAG: P1 family peptidase [Chloroflexota bacterium]|nr:P1 family peptidase [Chloroflexota bacterium]